MIVKQWKQNFLLYMLLIISAVMVFFPVLYAFLISFMTPDDIQMRRLFPTQFTFDNFINIFQKVPLFTYLYNSLIVSTSRYDWTTYRIKLSGVCFCFSSV